MQTVTRVSPAEAYDRINQGGFVYVDVRTPGEFSAGHPAGAVNVPWLINTESGRAPNPDFLASMRERFDLSAKLVVGCATGRRSLRAAEELLASGFRVVVDQRAGYDGSRGDFGELLEPGWGQSGLPVETSE